MRLLTVILVFFVQVYASAQDSIKTELDREISLKADRFVGVDEFENLYYIRQNTLYKKTRNQTYSYTNTQLGLIASVDIKNPLKVLLFYSNFNTALLLDNQLNELTRPFNFTDAVFSKNIALANLSSNDNLWLYSFDDNIIRLWNHQTKKIQFSSQPLSFYTNNEQNFDDLQQFSSYRNYWLVSKDGLTALQFDEYGIFLGSIDLDPFELIWPNSTGFFYINDQQCYFKDLEKNTTFPLTLKKPALVKDFYINNQQIFIFDGTAIFVYKILKK